MQTLKVKKVNKDAKLPTKAHEDDSCFDLYTVEDSVVCEYSTSLIGTGIAIQLPKGFEAQIRPRSSISKQGIHIYFGTIDENYRGELKILAVLLHKVFDDQGRERTQGFIPAGTRIAQMAIKRVPEFILEEVDELDETERGEKGFGSSGTK